MLKNIIKRISFVLLASIITGCASLGAGGNISTNNPEAYGDYQIDAFSNQDVIGKEALLGGMITTINSDGNAVRIEAVRYNLNADGFPITNSELDNQRLIVNIQGAVNLRGYSPGSYIAAVGTIKSADTVNIAGESVRVLVMDASDYQFWLSPQQQQQIYYDEPFFNSPAIRAGYWGGGPGFGFGFGGYPYYW